MYCPRSTVSYNNFLFLNLGVFKTMNALNQKWKSCASVPLTAATLPVRISVAILLLVIRLDFELQAWEVK
jgi:hypothetical protein